MIALLELEILTYPCTQAPCHKQKLTQPEHYISKYLGYVQFQTKESAYDTLKLRNCSWSLRVIDVMITLSHLFIFKHRVKALLDRWNVILMRLDKLKSSAMVYHYFRFSPVYPRQT